MYRFGSSVLVAVVAAAIPFAVNVCSGTPAFAQNPEIAALAPEAPAALCLDPNDMNPTRRIVACTAAVESRKLKDRDQARALVRRAEAYGAVGESSATAPRRTGCVAHNDHLPGCYERCRVDSVRLHISAVGSPCHERKERHASRPRRVPN
jgi:hypothetical protein